MSELTEQERIQEAYIAMAVTARYRPAAPGDGMGSIDLTDAERKDGAVLREEARQYAALSLGKRIT